MQRQRLTRQARMGTMQIFSELRQPLRRSVSRQTQQGRVRPTSPGDLPSSVWVSGMSSAAGSPSREGLHSAEWKGSRTSQQLPRTCLGNKSPSAHLQEAWPLTLSITMQSPPQPNDTASYREKSISRPSPRPLSKARGVQEEGRGGQKKKKNNNNNKPLATTK